MNQPHTAESAPTLVLRIDDGVPVLVIPDSMPFAELREWMREHMHTVIADIAGRASRLDLGEREIQLFDVRRLLHMLRDEFNVEITGLYVQSEAIHRYAERELKLKLFVTASEPLAEPAAEPEPPSTMPGLDDVLAALHSDAQASDEAVEEETDPQDAPTVFELASAVRRPIPTPDIPTDEPDVDAEGGRRTLSVHRTLRSGSIVRYDGDVNIFGDVNAGSQVRAGGNVVVMGRLRGVVHAGCHGDESAFILAFELSATQLRIGKQIAIAPPVRKSPNFSPEIALVSDGTITIEPYRGRLRR